MLRKAAPKYQPTPALETLRAEEWGLEDFVGVCNTLLPRYLPDDAMDRRQREDVSVRLLRYYASQGLLDEPGRQGREARYRYRHLLQVLVMRRLMRDGLGTKAILEVMRQPDESLEALLHGGAQLNVTPMQYAAPAASQPAPSREKALDFLAGIRQRSQAAPAASAPAPAPGIKAKKEASSDASEEVKPEQARLEQAEQPDQPEESRLARSKDTVLGEVASSKADLDGDLLETEHEARAESPQAPMPPARWTRFEIAQGVELHLSDQARLPRTPAERERLLETILDTLHDQLRRS